MSSATPMPPDTTNAPVAVFDAAVVSSIFTCAPVPNTTLLVPAGSIVISPDIDVIVATAICPPT